MSAQTNLFWDQNGNTAGTGGTGNWGAANAWRSVNDTGTLQNWDNGGTATANLGGTAGTITIDTSLTSGVTMAALNVNTSGYTITSASGNRPLAVSGSLSLANNVGLTLNMASTAPSWSLGTISFGAGSTLTVQGNGSGTASNRVSLTTSSTIGGGSIVLAGTGIGPTGFVASSTPVISVTLNTNILNNSATSATMLGANNSNSLSYGGVISGSAKLQISGGVTGGAGVVTLTNNSTYTGDTYLNHSTSGVLRLGIADALPTTTALFMAQSAGGGTADTGGTLDLAGFNQTLAGVDGAGRGIVNTGGAATLTLGGSGSYTLTSQIGIPTTTTNLTGANNNITVIKNGTGTQTLSGAKAFTGGLYINSGTLRITGAVTALGALPAAPASSVFLRGGTLSVDTSAGTIDSGANRGFEVGPTSGTGSVTIQVDGSNQFTVQGVIADTPGGSGRILKTGTGTLRLQTSAKTFTGGLSVLGGSVSFALDDRIGAVPATPTPGNIVLNNGGLLITGSLTLNANRGIALGPETGTGSGTINVGSGFTLTYEGIMADNGTGSGALIKAGQGTLRLQNAVNTFTGGLQVLEGDVSVGVDNRLGAVPAAATPGAIQLNGGGLTITADMTLSANRGIALGPNTGTGSGTIQVTGTNTLTYSGVIADNPGGSGRLIKTGTGTLRLQNSTNTFTGGLTVNGGLVSYSIEDRIGAAPATPTPASIILNGGGLRLSLNNMTINANRGIALGADGGTGTGTLSVETGRTLTYNGIIANNGTGTGALEKVDAGSLVLGGANTYSGGTTLTAGTLLVTNTTGSGTGTGPVTTAAGTTLGGNGTISPTATNSVIFGGAVAPSNNGTAGSLKFTPVDGNVTFQSTSNIVFELFGNGNNDKIVHAATGAGVLDFSAMTAGSISVVFMGGYTPGLGDTFDLLDWSGMSGLSTSQLSLTTAGFDPSWVWDMSQFTANGTLTIVLVPEPGRGAMVMAGLAAWRMRRRR